MLDPLPSHSSWLFTPTGDGTLFSEPRIEECSKSLAAELVYMQISAPVHVLQSSRGCMSIPAHVSPTRVAEGPAQSYVGVCDILYFLYLWVRYDPLMKFPCSHMLMRSCT
jgi:hypothetical protein